MNGCKCTKEQVPDWIDGKCTVCGEELSYENLKELKEEQECFINLDEQTLRVKKEDEECFILSQYLRAYDSKHKKIGIAFLNQYRKGTMCLCVFDETGKEILQINPYEQISIDCLYKDLVRARNKLNRRISTLKKANLLS